MPTMMLEPVSSALSSSTVPPALSMECQETYFAQLASTAITLGNPTAPATSTAILTNIKTPGTIAVTPALPTVATALAPLIRRVPIAKVSNCSWPTFQAAIASTLAPLSTTCSQDPTA